MTDETPPQPPDPGGLQFDRVESTQPIVAICSGCKGPLGETYYSAGPARICVRCRDGIQGHLEKGSAAARFFKAALLGVLAAAVGGSIWAYITYKSGGTVYGLVAIGLGYLIGIAVKKGSGERGGRGYQALALVLTYLGVAIGYVGAAIPELGKHPPKATVEEKAPADSSKPGNTAKPVKVDPAPAGCLLGLILVAGLCLGAPVMVGMESPITLVFLAIALWEAWKLNKGVLTHLKGPFRAGGGAVGG
jgi:hypothetical protein